MVATNTVWTLCHGRGEAYLAALRSAFRQELEAAQQRIRDSHDADFPMDAARRLEQIAAALLDCDLRDACRALEDAIETRLLEAPPPSDEAVAQAPAVIAGLRRGVAGDDRAVVLAAGEAAVAWIWLAATEEERMEWIAGPPNVDVDHFEQLAERASTGDDEGQAPH
jgi:hypothetical protein